MKISQVKEILDAEVLCGEDKLDIEFTSACASDLMSDVLAFVKKETMLFTGMVNPQVIRTAEMVDMSCIVFVRGKRPAEDMIKFAKEENFVILATDKRMYEACGLLYANNLGVK